MKKEYSILELIALELTCIPSSKPAIIAKATRENWKSKDINGKGGKKKLFTPPQYVLDAIKAQAVDQVIAETASAPLPALPEEKGIVHHLNDRQRLIESARMGVLKSIETVMQQAKCTKVAAMQTVLTQSKLPGFEHIAKQFELARDTRGAEGDLPSVRTLKRWFAQREENDLAPKVVEANFKIPEWAGAFLACYQQPQKPSVQHAYKQFIKKYNGELPSIHQCRRLLDKMGNVSKQRGRMAPRELKNIQPYVERDFSDMQANEAWVADGHTFDAEIRHPISGKPFRPEITSIIDIATRKSVGFSIDLAESALAVLAAISNAIKSHGVPAIFYSDNGPGYKNAMMTDEAVGLMGRLGITAHNSIAHNSQSRGSIERAHKTIWINAAQELPTYIGKTMDREVKQFVFKAIRGMGPAKKSKIHVMEWQEFHQYCQEKEDEYNNWPHSALPKITDESGRRRHMTPNEMWALKIQKGSQIIMLPEEDYSLLFRPQELRKTTRGLIQLGNNKYFSKELEEYHGETLPVAYDINDADYVWVYDSMGYLICRAAWNGNSKRHFPESMRDQSFEKRIDGQSKRLVKKFDAVEAARKPRVIEP